MTEDVFYGGPTAEDRICEALVDNLLLLYPNGPPAEDAQIGKWMEEIVQFEGISLQIQQELRAKDDTDRDNDTAVRSIYEKGLERAVTEWKARAAENQKQPEPAPTDVDAKQKVQKKSFSLFDQMDQGLWEHLESQ
ncbi:expressed unknown protein [Seminavis robusta]|uniref:Uncharacterized protein n=1 Tax=Seminavis robusta TaxID=568900 RepID=A0A9N8EU41_9STRA|nr:expressed unknown protein [Seminavis robusta]|eukprot:Sro2174_g317650.1 n/a (136) ;mRNA; f:1935-2342